MHVPRPTPWLAVGALVALAAGAALLSLATAPTAGARLPLQARLATATELGPGWEVKGTTPFQTNQRLIPCSNCTAAEELRLNLVGLDLLNTAIHERFQEVVLWSPDPGASLDLMARIIASPVFQPPRSIKFVLPENRIGPAAAPSVSDSRRYGLPRRIRRGYWSVPGPLRMRRG